MLSGISSCSLLTVPVVQVPCPSSARRSRCHLQIAWREGIFRGVKLHCPLRVRGQQGHGGGQHPGMSSETPHGDGKLLLSGLPSSSRPLSLSGSKWMAHLPSVSTDGLCPWQGVDGSCGPGELLALSLWPRLAHSHTHRTGLAPSVLQSATPACHLECVSPGPLPARRPVVCSNSCCLRLGDHTFRLLSFSVPLKCPDVGPGLCALRGLGVAHSARGQPTEHGETLHCVDGVQARRHGSSKPSCPRGRLPRAP